MEVVISLDDKKLKSYLKSSLKRYCYIYLGDGEKDISRLLKEHTSREIKIDDYDDSFKDSFLKSYIDLIGKLGLKYNSVYWWATNTAAKNQFGSNLFQNLFIFHAIVNKLNKLKKHRKEDILIIDPPKTICSSIAKYCLANSMDIKILSSPLPNILETIRETLSRIVTKVFFIGKTWQEIYISNKYFRKKFTSQIQREAKYYVLRSWFYSRSINENNEYQDSFFGILPHYVVKKRIPLIIVAGVMGNYRLIAKKIAANKDYLIVPQELFMGYMDPVKVIIDIYRNKIKIKEKIGFDGFDVSDIARAEIDREFRGGAILRSYIYHYYMKRLLNMINVDTFTTIYENNPWEKMCFLTIKKYSPQTSIIGYQHMVLSKAHINMYLSKHEKKIIPIPDKINTIGKITADFLERYGNYDKDKVWESCALRFETSSASRMIQRQKSYRILLVLGGISSRATKMANFVYQALKTNERYKIIIRPHPGLPLEYFTHELDFNIYSCNNFSLSNNTSVEKDLQEVDIVIYDASTISIEALMMGVPIIHIALNDILSFDPLFQCNYLKWTVYKKEELQKATETIYQLSDEEYSRQQAKARKYIEDYVYEITNERLDEFIIN